MPLARLQGWDVIVLDNASRNAVPVSYQGAAVMRFSKEYRREGLLGYPYAWRAIAMLGTILRDWEYERVVFIENDFFVCSQRLLDWADQQTGLACLWTPQYSIPESAFIVLTKCDEYDAFVRAMPWQERTGVLEQVVPWTHVEKGFLGDRYEGGPPPPYGIDFAAQLKFEDSIPQWLASS